MASTERLVDRLQVERVQGEHFDFFRVDAEAVAGHVEGFLGAHQDGARKNETSRWSVERGPPFSISRTGVGRLEWGTVDLGSPPQESTLRNAVPLTDARDPLPLSALAALPAGLRQGPVFFIPKEDEEGQKGEEDGEGIRLPVAGSSFGTWVDAAVARAPRNSKLVNADFTRREVKFQLNVTTTGAR